MDLEVKEKKKVKVPHVYVIVFFLVLIAAISTWFIPSGEFEYEEINVNGVVRNVAVPGSYKVIPKEETTRAGLIEFMSSFHKGMINNAEVMMLIFIVNGAFALIVKTGAFHAMLGSLLRKLGDKSKIIIPVFFVLFGLGASLFGMNNEYNGLIPIFVGLGTALGYDAMLGFAIIELGRSLGFAAAIMNPFTIVVAQSIAGVPIYSNTPFRIGIFIVFNIIGIYWIFRYARKLEKDPANSLMKDEETMFSFDREELIEYEVTNKHILIFIEMLLALLLIMYGFIKLEWGSIELSGIFLLMGIIAALINGWSPNKIAEEFIEGCRNIVYGALIVGFAGAILVVLKEAQVIDTIVNFMGSSLGRFHPTIAAQGMLFIQTIINFFIPSGSGQAATVIPMMAPIGDLVGVSREITVLAYQMGDGLSNLLWPTCGIVTACGIAGIPIDKWWKFFIPLFGIMYVMQMIIIFIATAIGM
ncbi:MAG TPA: YfcC family protein [Tissierellia bacterium]|nr:YfcC family protein [Tissierellia bacterium]